MIVPDMIPSNPETHTMPPKIKSTLHRIKHDKKNYLGKVASLGYVKSDWKMIEQL